MLKRDTCAPNTSTGSLFTTAVVKTARVTKSVSIEPPCDIFDK